MNDTAKVLTVKEVATYLKVHPSTVYRMIKLHSLPCFKIGSDWRFNIEAIDEWRQKVESGGPGLGVTR